MSFELLPGTLLFILGVACLIVPLDVPLDFTWFLSLYSCVCYLALPCFIICASWSKSQLLLEVNLSVSGVFLCETLNFGSSCLSTWRSKHRSQLPLLESGRARRCRVSAFLISRIDTVVDKFRARVQLRNSYTRRSGRDFTRFAKRHAPPAMALLNVNANIDVSNDARSLTRAVGRSINRVKAAVLRKSSYHAAKSMHTWLRLAMSCEYRDIRLHGPTDDEVRAFQAADSSDLALYYAAMSARVLETINDRIGGVMYIRFPDSLFDERIESDHRYRRCDRGYLVSNQKRKNDC